MKNLIRFLILFLPWLAHGAAIQQTWMSTNKVAGTLGNGLPLFSGTNTSFHVPNSNQFDTNTTGIYIKSSALITNPVVIGTLDVSGQINAGSENRDITTPAGRLDNTQIETNGATVGQVLKFDGASYIPQNDSTGGSGSVYVEGASITDPNFQSSSTAALAVGASTNITFNPTNLANAQIAAGAAIAYSKLALSGSIVWADFAASLVALVPRLDGTNNFTGTNSFAGITELTNLGNTISGNGAGLINLNASNLASGSVPIARIGDDTLTVAKIADGDWGNFTFSGNIATIDNNSINGAMLAMGSDAQGDLLYYNGTDYTRLGAGTSNQFLQTKGSGQNPTWATPSGSGNMSTDASNNVTGTILYSIVQAQNTGTNVFIDSSTNVVRFTATNNWMFYFTNWGANVAWKDVYVQQDGTGGWLPAWESGVLHDNSPDITLVTPAAWPTNAGTTAHVRVRREEGTNHVEGPIGVIASATTNQALFGGGLNAESAYRGIVGADIASGTVDNTQLSASANIARSKLAIGTSNAVAFNNGSGVLTDSANLRWIEAAKFLGIGTNSPEFNLQINGGASANVVLEENTASASSPDWILRKSRGTQASPTVVVNGDDLGRVGGYGYSGSAANWRQAADILFQVDGEPDTAGDTSDMPGRIVFSVSPDGASTATERMRISSDGNVNIIGTITNGALTVSVPVFTGPNKELTSTGTIDPTVTGITLKSKKYPDFVYPGKVDGTGCTILTNDYSNPLWGLGTFSGTAETNGNWSFYRAGVVPLDLDTSVELIIRNLAIRVSGTDADVVTLDFGLFSPAESAAHAPTSWASFSTFIRASETPSSPAAEDIFYFSDITLTGWAAGVTAGRPFIIGIARLNTANDDSVTIVSGTVEVSTTQ